MRAASQKSGYAQTTLQRQIDKGQLSPEMVIALCRAYDRSPVTGLIETGYIQPWEAEGVSIPFALEQASNQQILDEIMRRSDPEAAYLFTNTDHPEAIGLPDELSARRKSNITTPGVSDDGYIDGMPDDAVAYGHDEVGGTPDDFEP